MPVRMHLKWKTVNLITEILQFKKTDNLHFQWLPLATITALIKQSTGLTQLMDNIVLTGNVEVKRSLMTTAQCVSHSR